VSLPLDLQLVLAPLGTYRRVMAEPVRSSWLRALERPALLAVIIGTAVTMASARRVSIGLVLMGILCWSFVPLIQFVIGAIVIGRVNGRPTTMPRSLELLFIAHLPWSLWVLVMLGLSAFTSLPLSLAVQVLSLVPPLVWTTMMVFAFCRTVLGCAPARARLFTAIHQVMTWTAFFTYVFLVSGFLSRILRLVGA
jgi:hypothetical protein